MKVVRKEYLMAIFLLIIAQAGTNKVLGQSVYIDVALDTNFILVGDPMRVSYRVEYGANMQVRFPNESQLFPENISLINAFPADSVVQGSKTTVTRSFLITAFDSGLVSLPPQPFRITNNQLGQTDTIWSPIRQFLVSTVPVDMQKGIADIKKPMQAPLTFKEILPWLLGVLVLLLAIFVPLYIVKRRKAKKPLFIPQKTKEPPHVIALRMLDELQQQRLWQQNRLKQYYIQLSDIIREYIEGRYSIRAKEETTDQILSDLKYVVHDTSNQSSYSLLERLLRQADLVKFAKAQPLPAENDDAMLNAKEFVNQTKVSGEINNEQA